MALITSNIYKNTSEFKTLLGKEIKLNQNENVFMKNNEIINLAGVMGGETTKCSNSSTTALVECAYFNPDMIIGKSIKYDLLSDAAYKFERGVDICIQDFALRRFIKIVEDHAEIKSIYLLNQQNMNIMNINILLIITKKLIRFLEQVIEKKN